MENKNIFVSVVHVPEIQYENGWENFIWQQDCARRYGVNVTIGTKASLLSEDYIVKKFMEYQAEGDEIALVLNIIEGEEGEKSIDKCFEAYKQAFGKYPSALLSSRQDAKLWKYIKGKYPEVIAGIGFAFEEGDHVFHGHQIFNMEWMDFCEGTPWWPFWPSGSNKQCPASNDENGIEIMNFPWLVRDMIMSVLGRDDFYSSEIGDLLRSKLIDENDYSYLTRFFDACIDQIKYNPYTFYLMLQESGWLSPGPRVFEETHEVYKELYEKYFSEVFSRHEGIRFVTLSEYAQWHKNEFKGKNEPTVCVWDDIIYDSGKQYTWYQDANARLLFDSDRGASIVDFRPYSARIEKSRGSDSKYLWDGSYPYLIQSYHRCNSIHKCIIETGSESFNLAETESLLEDVQRLGNYTEFVFEPVVLKAACGELKIRTTYKINRENFCLEISRRVEGSATGKIRVVEDFTGCWGTDSHPVPLNGIQLAIKSGNDYTEIDYAYLARRIALENADSAEVLIPEADFKLRLVPENKSRCFIKEGDINSSFYELGTDSEIEVGKTVKTYIYLEQLN